MGTYSKSTFGKIKGKVGEGVGSKWRGVSVIRSLPTKSSKPFTASQLAIQAKFALSAAQLSPIKDVLNLGFSDKKLNKITGYNAAVKAFLAEAITGTYPNYGVDYSKMKMSKGSLNAAEIQVSFESAIKLSWPADLNDFNSSASDKMVFIVYNETKNTYKLNNSFTRDAESMSFPYTIGVGDVLHIWSFCVKHDGKTVSNSVYAGSISGPI